LKLRTSDSANPTGGTPQRKHDAFVHTIVRGDEVVPRCGVDKGVLKEQLTPFGPTAYVAALIEKPGCLLLEQFPRPTQNVVVMVLQHTLSSPLVISTAIYRPLTFSIGR
jgi:hypothetical protein